MATVAEIEELRLLIGIPSDTAPYTDEYLSNLIDEHGMDTAASLVWRQKAASYAGMVDMSESGSSRKLSQLRQAALEMADSFGPGAEAPSSFTWPIERV